MPSVSIDGVTYAYSRCGSGEPLVVLHGFTGSKDAWWLVRDRLASHVEVVAFDLLGHGASSTPLDRSRYGFEKVIDDLARAIGRIGINRATWLGYSLGGRLALGLTCIHPAVVSALIVESASPGVREAAERRERELRDHELAERIQIDGVEKFVAEWESLPLWQSQLKLPVDVLSRQRTIRLRNNEVGLANAMRGMGQGSQPSLWPRLREIKVPVLLLAGELDTKYAEIASNMAESLPDATAVIVPKTGHAIHVEAPAVFVDLVLSFLVENNK